MPGASAFYAVDILLIAAILSRWSREPFLPLLRSAAFTTVATFAIMGSVSLALVVLWTQSPALALVLAGPLVAVALHQRATHNALRAMRLALTDPLTGLGNHRHFQEQLQIQLEEASASRAAADRLPASTSTTSSRSTTATAIRSATACSPTSRAGCAPIGEAYRLGGDEFAVVFPGERADDAAVAAEELVRSLARGGLGAGRAARPDRRASPPIRTTATTATRSCASPTSPSTGRRARARTGSASTGPDMPAVTQLRRLTRAPDRAARLQAAAALANAVDARDAFEGSHSTRVGDLAAGIAGRLGLPEEEIELIRLAGRLHDIGKLAVPEEILRKPGPLTRREKDVLESHPQVGHGMLLPLDIEPVPTWVLHHHERWDGTGRALAARRRADPARRADHLRRGRLGRDDERPAVQPGAVAGRGARGAPALLGQAVRPGRRRGAARRGRGAAQRPAAPDRRRLTAIAARGAAYLRAWRIAIQRSATRCSSRGTRAARTTRQGDVVDSYELLIGEERKPMVVVEFEDGERKYMTATTPNVLPVERGGRGRRDEADRRGRARGGRDAGDEATTQTPSAEEDDEDALRRRRSGRLAVAARPAGRAGPAGAIV